MDSLTQQISHLDITSEAVEPDTADSVFEKISRHAGSIRNSPITADEFQATKQLASPFSPGGALFLLQDPRKDHPWSQGVAAVISDCPTLAALEEGARIASEGKLSLVKDISVLDLRPFISPEVRQEVRHADIEGLYSLVVEFICAKRPDVVLCLGRDATDNARAWGSRLPPASKLFYTLHPSSVINYNRHCITKRKKFLGDILRAIGHSRSSRILAILDTRTTAAPDVDPALSWTMHILRILAFLCFQYPIRKALPLLNLTPNRGYYCLQPWHIRLLRLRERQQPPSLPSLLCRFFDLLNGHITLDSWYLPQYRFELDSVLRLVRDFVEGLENLSENGLLSAREQQLLDPSKGMWVKFQSVRGSLFDIDIILSRLKPLVPPDISSLSPS
ncbi:hypothetical protein BJY01DRAFT_255839 [Aspergillus pseudoustus]|uniref:Uracil-DNA glycosylase-like domain-containing protein n=1 Tax=Aspergillus pseudoustus TaxID=1810923 RepID=A0ABR4IGT7_9EURO